MMSFADNYSQLVAEYAACGDESVLIRIGALGADAVLQELPLEEAADVHHAALATLGNEPLATDRAAICLSEFLMAFGLAYRDRSQRTLDLQRIDSHRQKMESLGRMAGGIAHEFNNLLQPITGHAEMALDDCHDEELNAKLWAILRSARKAAQIIRHLVTSARQMTPRVQAIQFGRTIQGDIQFLREALPHSLVIEESIADLDTPILGNAAELEQIVHNLVRNAADAVGGLGTIQVEVTASLSDATVGLSVRDFGCGMDPATASRMFEPFFTTKDLGHGTGLGLAVVQGIVTDWKGSIAVDTAPGKGTTISITLPSVGGEI